MRFVNLGDFHMKSTRVIAVLSKPEHDALETVRHTEPGFRHDEG